MMCVLQISFLSLFDIDAETLTSDVIAVSEYLSTKKQYKGLILGYPKSERMMHAAMMVMADNMTEKAEVLSTAAIYLSCLYIYEIEQGISDVTAIIPLLS